MHNAAKKRVKNIVIFSLCAVVTVVLIKVCAGFFTSAEELKEADIAEFLTQSGWKISASPVGEREVVIPTEFSEVYEGYNEIQLSAGYDLRKYRGETVKKYTYAVFNYKDESGKILENIRANVLTADGKIIGGDICSLELDGFMHGLTGAAG